MSTDTIEKPVVKKTEPLLSKRRKKFVTDPLNDDNPITIQVLGICSALAVTVKLEPTFVMSCSVVAVIVMANLIISSIRDLIPNRVRIIVQLAIIASLVVLVDQILKAYFYDVSKMLSVFADNQFVVVYLHGRVRTDTQVCETWPIGLLEPFVERLANECKRGHQNQNGIAAHLLRSPHRYQCLACAAGHYGSRSVVIFQCVEDVCQCCALMRPRLLPSNNDGTGLKPSPNRLEIISLHAVQVVASDTEEPGPLVHDGG